MTCTEQQREFVRRHVTEFSKRHAAKISQLFPSVDVEEVIRKSENLTLITTMEKVDAMDAELTALQNKMKEVVAQFNKEHGSIVSDLVAAARSERVTTIRKQQEEFDYKLRTAIGLVELVGTKEAYDVLEACRSQIEAM